MKTSSPVRHYWVHSDGIDIGSAVNKILALNSPDVFFSLSESSNKDFSSCESDDKEMENNFSLYKENPAYFWDLYFKQTATYDILKKIKKVLKDTARKHINIIELARSVFLNESQKMGNLLH